MYKTMKKFLRNCVKIVALFASLLIAFVCIYNELKARAIDSAKADAAMELDRLQKKVTVFQNAHDARLAREKEETELGTFVLKAIGIVNVKMPKVQRTFMAQRAVRVLMNVFSEQEHRKSFVLILSIENAFRNNPVSTAGAKGIAQLMPQYVPEFAKKCGMAGVQASDLTDTDLALTVGACHYRDLIEQLDGSPILAAVAYNSGLYSGATESMKALKSTNRETDSYVAKFSYVRERIEKDEDK